MSSSILIRDRADQIIGYVLMSNQQMCIRIAGHGTQAEARIDKEDGECCIQVVCDGHEQVFPCESETKIEWIKVVSEGRMIAFGGKLPETEDIVEMAAAEGIENSSDESNDHAEYSAATAVHTAQRRWPPPPCWPSACYVEGAWIEGKI